jgi:hypothetical protein
MPRQRPSVKTKCVAGQYAAANERIVEFSGPTGTGGLISFTAGPEGKLLVQLYRLDPLVQVRVCQECQPAPGDVKPGALAAWRMLDGNVMAGFVRQLVGDYLTVCRVDGGICEVPVADAYPASPDDVAQAIAFYTRKEPHDGPQREPGHATEPGPRDDGAGGESRADG